MDSRPCLILFGPPGSGKGTQAKLLKESLGMAHISTGDILRERVARAKQDPLDVLGRQVAEIMQSGALVSDALVNRMVEERISQPDTAKGFMLDGYPRTVAQAKLLDCVLRTQKIRTVVVHLKVDYNVIIARLSGRRQCPKCGALYNVSTSSGTEACEKEGTRLIVRDDDREEVVGQRLKAYDLQTAPVLEYLRGAGYPCFDVPGDSRPPEAIAADIRNLIGKEFASGIGQA